MMKKDQMRFFTPTFFASSLMLAVSLLLISASGCETKMDQGSGASEGPSMVQIDTRFGPMVVQLSDSTPVSYTHLTLPTIVLV